MSFDFPTYTCCNSPIHIGHAKSCGSVIVLRMRRVVLESPYRGEIERNVIYARRATRDSLLRGESPSPMHLVHPQPGILRDEVPEERALGIAAHIAWIEVADVVAMYVDYGISGGMKEAQLEAERLGKIISIRKIGENP